MTGKEEIKFTLVYRFPRAPAESIYGLAELLKTGKGKILKLVTATFQM